MLWLTFKSKHVKLTFAQIDCNLKFLYLTICYLTNSVKIREFFCHSDFTWNQLRQIGNVKTSTISKLYQKWFHVEEKFLNFHTVVSKKSIIWSKAVVFWKNIVFATISRIKIIICDTSMKRKGSMYHFDLFPINSIQSKHEIDLQSLATTGIEPDAFSHVKSMFCFKYCLCLFLLRS